MGKLAFLFAGQGAQAPGMGKSLYELGGAAAAPFGVMEARRPGTLADCFEGSAGRLAQTPVTQPCVYTVDLACAAALADAGIKPDGAAGFSLGEMAALTFAGVFGDEAGARLVCRRGEVMGEAAAARPGAMAAVMRLEDAVVEGLCKNFRQLWPVNYNCPGQLVVAGDEGVLDDFCAAAKQAGGVAKRLAVGGAFHTPFMQGAADKFAGYLADVPTHAPGMPVYANLDGMPYGQDVAGTLAAQMFHPVRWSATIRNMAADGFDTFVEVGPGRTLSGFVRRILPDATMLNVQDAESLAATLEALRQ